VYLLTTYYISFFLSSFFVLPVALRPNAGHGFLILEVSRSHTTKHHSRQDFSGRVISPSQRSLPDNTRHSQQTNIHAPSAIRTHDFSRRAAAYLRLRPHGHWDRPPTTYSSANYTIQQIMDDRMLWLSEYKVYSVLLYRKQEITMHFRIIFVFFGLKNIKIVYSLNHNIQSSKLCWTVLSTNSRSKNEMTNPYIYFQLNWFNCYAVQWSFHKLISLKYKVMRRIFSEWAQWLSAKQCYVKSYSYEPCLKPVCRAYTHCE
jgi:hypothetical protein